MSSYFKSKKFNKKVHYYKTKEYKDTILDSTVDEYICVDDLQTIFQKDNEYKNIYRKLNSYKKYILKDFIESDVAEKEKALNNELYKRYIESDYISVDDLCSFLTEYSNNKSVQDLTIELTNFLDIHIDTLVYEKYRRVLINKILKKFKTYKPIVKYIQDVDYPLGCIDIYLESKNIAIYIDNVSDRDFVKKLMNNKTKINCKSLIFSSINKQNVHEILSTIELTLSV